MPDGVPYVLRPHQPSDMKRIVQLHNKVRLEEFGFNKEFEAMVKGIVVDFAKDYNPKREHCWIAETGREPVGCVFLVEKSETLAQLRLLLVDSRARGLGEQTISRLLLDICTRRLDSTLLTRSRVTCSAMIWWTKHGS